MGYTGEQECAGRGDGSRCPEGAVLTIDAGPPEYRCDECRHYWELDETEPYRRAGAEDMPTLSPGDPGEVGRGTAALPGLVEPGTAA
ncbi:hypothetical protein AB0D49_29275 [Streptomyces sp. NPDC048290]|uniref:hypothetical protein n=1 Tax=Streptomyces sp. NPDC048290 TaxID=3155811 RepID=UPI00342B383C